MRSHTVGAEAQKETSYVRFSSEVEEFWLGACCVSNLIQQDDLRQTGTFVPVEIGHHFTIFAFILE